VDLDDLGPEPVISENLSFIKFTGFLTFSSNVAFLCKFRRIRD